MTAASPPPADYFDRWYANMSESPAKDEIMQRHLGLPAHVLSTSLLSWEGIAEVTARLRLSPGKTVLDLACGRGGCPDRACIHARTDERIDGVGWSGSVR